MQTPLQWLEASSFEFPDPATALRIPNGLLAIGGDLHPERLLKAYQRGIFPWFEADQPPLWWSPDPRMVLLPYELHISRSMQKFCDRTTLVLSSDQAFDAVVQACAGPRRAVSGTWITPAMQHAYHDLYQAGFAHSVEVWNNKTLVGGLYGVALGDVFFGESMFSHESNASKFAFIHLVRALAAEAYSLIDCQIANPHLVTLGARNIPRDDFIQYLPKPEEIHKPPRWPVQLLTGTGSQVPI